MQLRASLEEVLPETTEAFIYVAMIRLMSQGTDVIRECGKGPARLKAGNTDYLAIGTRFGPDPYTLLQIDLRP